MTKFYDLLIHKNSNFKSKNKIDGMRLFETEIYRWM